MSSATNPFMLMRKVVKFSSNSVPGIEVASKEAVVLSQGNMVLGRNCFGTRYILIDRDLLLQKCGQDLLIEEPATAKVRSKEPQQQQVAAIFPTDSRQVSAGAIPEKQFGFVVFDAK